MIQEVQVILTMEVDASKSKEDIKRFFLDMEQTYTQTVSSKNRWEYPKIVLVDIKEEAEIYETEPLERGKVDLRECEEGDTLISALGAKLQYVRPTKDSEYLDHVVKYLDGQLKGSLGTRTHDGYVFKFKRLPETDHDIVKVIKKKK